MSEIENYELINFDSLKQSPGTHSSGEREKFQQLISYNLEL
jgi:hypothetical protein